MPFISEILPNPKGSDQGAEWVELGNNGAEAVSLAGWTLRDASGKRMALRGEIAPGGYRVFEGPDLGLSLNNAEETLILLDPKGTAADTISWSAAPEGESFARDRSGFMWTQLLTPGAANRVEGAMFEDRLLLAREGTLVGASGISAVFGIALVLGLAAAFFAQHLNAKA
ncbi:MAG: hypothetical protein A2128_00390 [Candidatus Liptonbacteria bacterium GWC1_60_9]|uniref:LTD domain-containing protein n=3 Tax=Candidatus Liptoniibacteriota TaxID=1817909 RepID=A0A1G2CM83_9BACT|nr:MAG: hypothetical protein A2128_00390 [Candidatus Liptonbacteria bacterium GWC1_60_9]OGZ00049.1 MAG: hypothetical protein A3E09_01260 [Candidatus Liptonbacteria bacterium RIFCSPHIGHO2_12_FULL_60_13]OGZ02312.1 MAG: hypothetical protein A3G64_02420 [Candidatus Liptonbacteria bacterium RIFCSPLOWO2_12_FULL_60_15]